MEQYWYCSVRVKNVGTPYSYISDDGELPIGCYVAVPFGTQNNVRIGVVVACAAYTAENAPYPVERTKHIIHLASKEDYDADGGAEHCFAPEPFDEVRAWIEEEDWEEVMDWASEHHDDENPETIRMVIECYERCIDADIPEAALNLGTFYYTGRCVPLDYRRAFELYKIAADAGVQRAICNCGYCFYYGRHQKADYAEALRYFTLGALLFDDANCLYKIGDHYLNGYAVEKNEGYAFKLYDRALHRAQEDDDGWAIADAQFRIGKCLLRGIGTETNVETGHALLSLSLLNFYKRRKKDPFAMELIRKAQELIEEARAILDADC